MGSKGNTAARCKQTPRTLRSIGLRFVTSHMHIQGMGQFGVTYTIQQSTGSGLRFDSRSLVDPPINKIGGVKQAGQTKRPPEPLLCHATFPANFEVASFSNSASCIDHDQQLLLPWQTFQWSQPCCSCTNPWGVQVQAEYGTVHMPVVHMCAAGFMHL